MPTRCATTYLLIRYSSTIATALLGLTSCGTHEGTPAYSAAPVEGTWNIISTNTSTIGGCEHSDLAALPIGLTVIAPLSSIEHRQFYADLEMDFSSQSTETFHLLCQMHDLTSNGGAYIPPLPFDCTATSERFFQSLLQTDAATKLILSLTGTLDEMAFGADLPEFSGNYSRFQDGAYTLTTTEDCEGSDCGTEAAVGSGVCVASGELTAIWSGCGDPYAMCADSAEQLE